MKTLFLLLSAGAVLSAADVTFSETVAPIIYQNCITCHRPGEAAPFSLISYDDVKKRGALIANVTQSRYMPPWHAEHGYGDFADERRLTDQQIATIGDWVKRGMPQGDPAKMPKLPQFTEGWHLGKPDLILEMPASYEVPASGPDVYRNFAIPTNLTEDKWVRAVEFRPGTRTVVHHALIAYVRAGAVANLDGKDGKPGFSGMTGLGLGIAPGMAPSGALGGWAVGNTPIFLPEGQAIPLAKGTDLIIQMHFHPVGKPESERATVGIYFADKAPETSIFGGGLPFLFGIGSGLDIPAGAKDYTIKDSMTLPVDVKVFGVNAHAHYLGKEMKATATLPDGRIQPLLWIKDWNFNWQEQYNYKHAVALPKGTRIDVSISYDNSADNPRNPTNPPKRVQWGEQSFDEMGGVGFTMVTLRKEDEATLSASFDEGTKAAIAKGLQDGTVRRFLEEQNLSRVNAAAAPQLQRITVFDRQGKTLTTLGEPGLYSQPALSPDGTRVAAIRTDTNSGNRDVWVFDIASGKGAPVTSDATPRMSPVWSPDGKQIAYTSIIEKNTFAIYRKASDGSGSEELIYQHTPGAAVILTDWSNDGRICFWSGRITYAVSVSGDRKPVELFHEEYNVRGGRFSPDGRFLGYNSDESGKFQTYVGALNPVSKGQQVSKEPAAGGIFWREDAKELYFLSLPPEQAMMAVDVTTSPTFQTGTPRMLFKLPSPIGAPAQLSSVASRDGQRFVFIVQTSAASAAR